jgi:uncharacterized repeat protein (TIGR03803 family)
VPAPAIPLTDAQSGATIRGCAERPAHTHGGTMRSVIASVGVFVSAILCTQAARSGTETILHCFGGSGDGTNPLAGMTNVNGILYGTTEFGGKGACVSEFGNGCGVVFSYDPATNKERVVYSFMGGTADGELPYYSRLQYANGLLYGTTYMGGSSDSYCYNSFGSGCGTVFSIDPSTGKETVLHKFQGGGTDGIYPLSTPTPIFATDGGAIALFGTTTEGGTNTCQNVGCGTVYKIDLTTGTETIAYSFKGGNDGFYPTHALAYFDHKLYSTTAEGGKYSGYGTIFSFDPKKGTEGVLHSFGNGSDGKMPYTAMTRIGNVFYGTTFNGGAAGFGTLFSFDPATRTESILHSFTNTGDGDNPATDLIHKNVFLYGTTSHGEGTVYSFNTKTNTETVYSTVGNSNDPFEDTRLTLLNHILYGTATQSESCGYYGAIYSVTKKS